MIIDDIRIVEIRTPKMYVCQFCGTDTPRQNTRAKSICIDCKGKRDKENMLKRYHLKNPNAKYK